MANVIESNAPWMCINTVSAGSHYAIFPQGKIAPFIADSVKQLILNATIHATRFLHAIKIQTLRYKIAQQNSKSAKAFCI